MADDTFYNRLSNISTPILFIKKLPVVNRIIGLIKHTQTGTYRTEVDVKCT